MPPTMFPLRLTVALPLGLLLTTTVVGLSASITSFKASQPASAIRSVDSPTASSLYELLKATDRATEEETVPLYTVPEVIANATYPVCNGPDTAYDPLIDLWRASILRVCQEEAVTQSLACNQTVFACCRDLGTLAIRPSVTCHLGSGLCSVHDTAAGTSLVGAWKATSCGLGGARERLDGTLKRYCRCAPVRAVAGDFPTPPCVVVHKPGAFDPATGLTTAATIPFGPYVIRRHGPAETNAVTSLDTCVPDTPVAVRRCGVAENKRGTAVYDACGGTRWVGTPTNGTAGQCCMAILRGSGGASTSIIWCVIGPGGGCVRRDFTHAAVAVDDFAARPGCLVPGATGGSVTAPGAAPPAEACICVPAVGVDAAAGGCAVALADGGEDGDGEGEGEGDGEGSCVVMDSAAGSLLASSTVRFTPVLDRCAA